MRLYGGRASLLWDVTPDLSIRLSTINQQRRWDGMNFVDIALNSLTPLTCNTCQQRDVPQRGYSSLELYNATINWDLGPAELTSSTTYDKFYFVQDRDLVGLRFLGDIRHGVPGAGLWGLAARFNYWGDEIVHETRLSSSGDRTWNWQVGLYYTNKDTAQDQSYLPSNRTTHLIEDGNCGRFPQKCRLFEYSGTTQPGTYREFAAFANVNFEVTPEFDVSLGGRYSDQAQTFEQIGRTPSNPTLPLVHTKEEVFTFSGDARWRFTEGSMVYARVASGFVPGGSNVAPVFPTPGFPLFYNSSTTVNYEVGLKSQLLDKSLTVELAAFLIDWSDIQVGQVFPSAVPGLSYNALTNAATARSQGVEWALTYKPVTGLTLGFNGAYTDAHLTEKPPAGVVGYDGEPLPVTPKWQLAGSADYKWPMMGVTGFVGADWRYLGRRFTDLTNSAATRTALPSYHIFDLRAGVEGRNWRLAAYVKNVGNEIAVSYVYQEVAGAFRNAFFTTPRQVGIDLSFDF